MRILVTGAAGYIGQEIVRRGVALGHEIVGIDSFDDTLYPAEVKRRRASALKEACGISVSEINPLTSDLKNLDLDGFNAIINEMAVPGLAPSWKKLSNYFDSNVLSLEKILQQVVSVNPEIRIVQASTSSVYGNTDGSGTLSPISPYGVTKLAAENLLNAFASQFGLEVAILRYFSVFGGRQRPDMAYSKFIKKISSGEPIELFGDGSQSRTNTHVADVARATLLAAEKRGSSFTIDVSGHEEVSLMSAIRAIEKGVGKKAEIIRRPFQPGDQSVTRGNISPAKEILGWEPQIDFLEGIQDQINATLSKNG